MNRNLIFNFPLLIFVFLCRDLYAKLKSCIKNVVRECRDKTDPGNLARIESRSRTMIASRSYYCEDGMMNSFKRNRLPDCRRRALEKVKKCTESFHEKFRKNKGSPSLCRHVRRKYLSRISSFFTFLPPPPPHPLPWVLPLKSD